MIPQIIARDADEMKVLMDKMLPMGYYPQRRLFVLALFWQLSQLCLNHHVAIQRNVEEKQIDEFLLSAYLQAVFSYLNLKSQLCLKLHGRLKLGGQHPRKWGDKYCMRRAKAVTLQCL